MRRRAKCAPLPAARTNTPLQALVLLERRPVRRSGPRPGGRRFRSSSDNSTNRIARRIPATDRPTADAERNRLLRELYDEQRRCLRQRPARRRRSILELGDSKPSRGFDAAELAALTVVCQAILNLDATIYER